MKQTVNKNDFIDAFKQAGREDNFSHEGLCALFDYFEQLEEDCGIEIELDVIAICCEYTEYEEINDFCDDYGGDYMSVEDIREQTQVIEFGDGQFIIQDF